jgi:hypothetical protein
MVYMVGAWRGGEAEISVGEGVELRGLGLTVGVRRGMGGLRVGAMRGLLEVWVEWLMLLSSAGELKRLYKNERLGDLRGY